MNEIKTNRVIGARGIGVYNSNLNAAFDSYPKMLVDGTFMNSDVCTKYADRMFWRNIGQKVLIQKMLKTDKDGNLYAATQEEIIAEKVIDKKRPNLEILNEFIDVQNFGATIATKGISLGTTGVVQYTQGINKLKNSSVIVQDIISSYGTGGNKKKKDDEKVSTATNIGKHIFVDKALYVQSFVVNPINLNSLQSVFGDDFVGYKKESYELFKKAVLCSITLQSSRTKEGCCDDFAIFINLKEDSYYALNNIQRFIEVEEETNKNIIDFTPLDFLNEIEDVENIEIFYNSKNCEIKHNFKNVTIKDTLKGF